MDRRQEILKFVRKGARGIEVAPWHNPIVPPDTGYEVVVLDVFDRTVLIERAEADPAIGKALATNISEVDLVGSACEVAELARARFGDEAQFDFVVSSHNFEHLPDPVRFLRGCEALLAPGGVVAMAVPDKRACFDFFRPHSSSGEILQAFHERRERPTFAQTFNQDANTARLRVGDTLVGAFSLDNDQADIVLEGDAVRAYSTWLDRIEIGDTNYYDTHCWTFTPASMELILLELILFGLIDLEIASVSEAVGCEFYVHLRKRQNDAGVQHGLREKREMLLHRIVDELAQASRLARGTGGGSQRKPQIMLSDVLPGPGQRDLLRRIRSRIRRDFGF